MLFIIATPSLLCEYRNKLDAMQIFCSFVWSVYFEHAGLEYKNLELAVDVRSWRLNIVGSMPPFKELSGISLLVKESIFTTIVAIRACLAAFVSSVK
jgi:hypothetical protein